MTSEQPDCGAEYLLHNILIHSLLKNATNEGSNIDDISSLLIKSYISIRDI
jgi:hypothetical protein